jgi:ribose transport system ATP-binding protein
MNHLNGIAVGLEKVRKTFGATVALDGVSFEIKPGKTHALLGENGAGKSTIVKLLSGLIRPDAGAVSIFCRQVRIDTPRHAQALGIQTAFQELSLVPELTVAQNMFLGVEPLKAGMFVDRYKLEQEALTALTGIGLEDINPRWRIDQLSLPLRQKVEIAKAVARKPQILLLDEPTSTLSSKDVNWVADVINRLEADGVTILFISHRLQEAREFCESLTVLRNGANVGDFQFEEINDNEIVSLIIGRSLGHAYPPRSETSTPTEERPILCVRNLSTANGLKQVSFSLRRNEILGVAALQGMGQSELFLSLFGMRRATGGQIELDGRSTVLSSPIDAIRKGIAYVPEDRKNGGLFLNLPVGTNVSIPVINRFRRLGWMIDRKRENRAVTSVLKSVGFDPLGSYRPCSSFSGGNQQKITIAKWLMAESRVLLMFDPTRGVDIGAKSDIYVLMQQFKSDGGAIIFYSSEIPELVNLCDRVIVLYGGRVTQEFLSEKLSEDLLIAAAMGYESKVVSEM